MTDRNKKLIKKLRISEIRSEISSIRYVLKLCAQYGATSELREILLDTRNRIEKMFKVRNDFSFLEVENGK